MATPETASSIARFFHSLPRINFHPLSAATVVARPNEYRLSLLWIFLIPFLVFLAVLIGEAVARLVLAVKGYESIPRVRDLLHYVQRSNLCPTETSDPKLSGMGSNSPGHCSGDRFVVRRPAITVLCRFWGLRSKLDMFTNKASKLRAIGVTSIYIRQIQRLCGS